MITKEEIVENIKRKRVSIDELMELSKTMVHSDLTIDARKHIRRAYSWLGKCLGSLSNPNPYPESTNPNSKVIEKRADTTNKQIEPDLSLTPLALIKSLRSKLDELADWSVHFFLSTNQGREFQIAFTEFQISINDAKMLFGWELDRIKRSPQSYQTTLSEKTLEEISKEKNTKKWLEDSLS